MESKKIFAVDDEEHILELIFYNLTREGYRVYTFCSAEEMLAELSLKMPDLFILDVMLPGIDGIDLCKMLRQKEKTSKIPIIMLTAKGEEIDKIIGLEMGADDYITKPFSVRELIARIKVILRRSPKNDDDDLIKDKYAIKDITIDIKKREVLKNNKQIQLTYKEFELLYILIQNKGNVLSRDTLLDKVWGYDFSGETRTVDVHIRNLRKNIGDFDESYIETIRGIGYKLKEN